MHGLKERREVRMPGMIQFRSSKFNIDEKKNLAAPFL